MYAMLHGVCHRTSELHTLQLEDLSTGSIPFLRCVLQPNGEEMLGDCLKSSVSRGKVDLSGTLWQQLSTTNIYN